MHCAELWQYASIFFFSFNAVCTTFYVRYIFLDILFVFSTFYSVREVLWDWTLWMSWWGTLWWSWCLLYGPWQLRWGEWYNIIQECKYLTVFDHFKICKSKGSLPSFGDLFFSFWAGMTNISCHKKFKQCLNRLSKSIKQSKNKKVGFSKQCPYSQVIPTMNQGMDIGIMFSQLGNDLRTELWVLLRIYSWPKRRPSHWDLVVLEDSLVVMMINCITIAIANRC